MNAKRPKNTVRRAQRGAIAIMTAILLPVLAAFAALSVDVGRMYVFKTEIQNAMDACALAASAPLTGANNPALFDQARAYGLALSDPSLNGAAARTATSVNRLHFQRDNFVANNIVVEFSSALAGAAWVEATSTSYTGITPATAIFVRCTYTDANNPLFLLPLLRVLVPGAANSMTVAATAAATLANSESACIFPVAVCAAPGSTAANNYGHTIGERLTAVNNPSSGYGTGNFGWLDMTPPAGGASELRNLMTNPGACSAVSVGALVGQPGAVSTLESAWNTRFGLYKNGTYNTTNAPPDFTGYSYPTGSNHYANYVTRLAARTPFQGITHNSVNTTTQANHVALGGQRRIAVAAVVNCSVWAVPPGAAQPPVLDFSCILLLAPVQDGGPAAHWSQIAPNLDIEYLGLSSSPGSPCASSGLAGGLYGPKVPALAQ